MNSRTLVYQHRTGNAIFNAQNVHALNVNSSAEMETSEFCSPANCMIECSVPEFYSLFEWLHCNIYRTELPQRHYVSTRNERFKFMGRNTFIMNSHGQIFFLLFQEIAALLISFDKHSEWQSKEVRTRWVPSVHLVIWCENKLAPTVVALGTHKFDWFNRHRCVCSFLPVFYNVNHSVDCWLAISPAVLLHIFYYQHSAHSHSTATLSSWRFFFLSIKTTRHSNQILKNEMRRCDIDTIGPYLLL